MEINLTVSTQDYLKAIYELVDQEGEASTTSLARHLGITPASVTGMLQRLAACDPPLVDYRKSQGVRLTEQGERAALEVIRHHRLIETYLVKALGYTWDNVHEEACRLEHAISEDFEQRIAGWLGDPLRDPHGEPIPTPALEMPKDDSQPLSELRPQQKAVVQRVRADDLGLLRHLKRVGLVLGAKLQVTGYSSFDQNLTLSIGKGKEMVVGQAVSSAVFVKKI